jgi:hypothetical protein
MPTLPFIQPSSAEVPYLAPDMSFLQGQLDRANQRYEEGLQEIKSNFSAILSAPVTGEQMEKRKAEYVKQFQEGIKGLAGQDVSDPKVMRQADKIMLPFWQDDLLVTNTGLTKYAQSQVAKLNSWRDSKDKDVHDRFDPYAVEYIQQGLDELGRTPLDKAAYAKLRKRDAIEFKNIDADVDAAWEQEVGKDKGIESVTTAGGAMITHHNGIKSKDAYKTYYLSNVGSKYDAQLAVIASVKAGRAKREIFEKNPGISQDEVNKLFAQQYITDLGQKYKETSDIYQEQANFYETIIKKLDNQIKVDQKGVILPTQEVDMAYYMDKLKDVKSAANNYSTKYWTDYSPLTINKTTNEQYYKTLNHIANNPEQYISDIEKQNLAENWAVRRAAITSEKREVDPVFKEYNELAWRDAQLKRDYAQMQLTKRGQDLDIFLKTGINPATNQRDPRFDPNRSQGWYGDYAAGTGPGQGGTLNEQGRVTGTNIIDPQQVKIEAITSALQEQQNAVVNSVFDASTSSFCTTVLNSLGITDDDTIINFTEAAKAMMNGPITNREQATAFAKVREALKSKGISYQINGPHAMMAALNDFSKSTVAQLTTSPKKSDQILARQLGAKQMVINDLREKAIKSHQNFDNAVKDKILSDAEFSQMVVNTPAGKRMVTDQDLVAYMPEMEVVDQSGKVLKLTKEDIAKAVSQSRFDLRETGMTEGITDIFTEDWDVKVDGIPYKIKRISAPSNYKSPTLNFQGNRDIVSFSRPEDKEVGKNAERFDIIEAANRYFTNERFGSLQDFTKLRARAAQKVLPEMKEFKSGLIAKEVTFDPNASKIGYPLEEKKALKLGAELASVSNSGSFYMYTPGENKEVALSATDEAALRNILSSVGEMQNKVGSFVKTKNASGEDVVKVVLKGAASDKAEERFPLSGKAIYLRLSPNMAGPELKSLVNNEGNYIWDNMYDGASYETDQTLAALGYKARWKSYAPGPDGKMTKVNYSLSKLIPDPNNPGKFIEQPEVKVTIPLSGENKKNPDEIREAHLASIASFLNNSVQNIQTSYQNLQGGRSYSEFQKQNKK